MSERSANCVELSTNQVSAGSMIAHARQQHMHAWEGGDASVQTAQGEEPQRVGTNPDPAGFEPGAYKPVW